MREGEREREGTNPSGEGECQCTEIGTACKHPVDAAVGDSGRSGVEREEGEGAL